MSTRLSVNVNDETAEALRDLANRRGQTVTEVIRRAVSVYKFVDDNATDGKDFQVVDRERKEVTSLKLV